MKDQRSKSKLMLKEFKLNALLEITKSINENLPTSELFRLFEFILRNQLSIGKAILFSKQEEQWQCVLKFGSRGSVKQFDVTKDLMHIKEITVIESSSREHLNSFDVVIPIYHKNIPLAYLLLGDLDEQEIRISPIIKHLPFIQTLANIIAVAIENKRLAQENLVQERVKRELELASEVQSMLFPSDLPNDQTYQVAAYYQPHQQVGGDYYDFIHLNDNEVMFCMADVSGKGVSAALLMSNFQANLRALVTYASYSLNDMAEELNHRVMESAKGEKYITLFIAKYNKETRALEYINAAHNPPVLVQQQNQITQLDEGCTGIGMFDRIPKLQVGSMTVPEGSILCCYTDGVIELENNKGEEYGVDALISTVRQHHQLSMDELNQEIIKEINQYKEDTHYVDDITLLSIRFN